MRKFFAVLCLLSLTVSFSACNLIAHRGDKTTDTIPETIMSEEEKQLLKKQELLGLYKSADTCLNEAKQINYDIQTKFVITANGLETISNQSSTVKINISDEDTEYYCITTTYAQDVSSTMIMAYADGNAYYCSNSDKLKSRITYEEFAAFANEILYIDTENECDYDNFSDFTYEELSNKYIGTFKTPDDEAKAYFEEMLVSSLVDEKDNVVSCTFNDISIESTINKDGYYESETIEADLSVEFKTGAGDETMTIGCVFDTTLKLNSINEEVDITLPADIADYITTNNLLVSSEYSEKINTYVMGIYGDFRITNKYGIDMSGDLQGKYTDVSTSSVKYNDAGVIESYNMTGVETYNGKAYNYSESFQGTTYSCHYDGENDETYESTPEEMSSSVSGLAPGYFDTGYFSSISVRNNDPESGYILTAEIADDDDGNLSSGIIYNTLYLLTSDPAVLVRGIADYKFNSFIYNVYYDDNDVITSFDYTADITVTFIDGSINIEFTYSSCYESNEDVKIVQS